MYVLTMQYAELKQKTAKHRVLLLLSVLLILIWIIFLVGFLKYDNN